VAMRKWLDEMSGLVWTLAGTGLVLVTLSGSTRQLGFIISASALLVHLILISMKESD
jgi:hypothetical protein